MTIGTLISQNKLLNNKKKNKYVHYQSMTMDTVALDRDYLVVVVAYIIDGYWV